MGIRCAHCCWEKKDFYPQFRWEHKWLQSLSDFPNKGQSQNSTRYLFSILLCKNTLDFIQYPPFPSLAHTLWGKLTLSSAPGERPSWLKSFSRSQIAGHRAQTMDMRFLYNAYAPIRNKMTFSRGFLGKRRSHLSESDAGGKFFFLLDVSATVKRTYGR